MSLQNVEGQAAHRGEIARSIAFLDFAGVLAETNIQLPVFVIFNRPVVAGRFRKLASSRAPTGDEVADFLGRVAVDGAFAPTQAHGGEASPEFAVANSVQIRDRTIRARLFPAMGFLGGRDGRDL